MDSSSAVQEMLEVGGRCVRAAVDLRCTTILKAFDHIERRIVYVQALFVSSRLSIESLHAAQVLDRLMRMISSMSSTPHTIEEKCTCVRTYSLFHHVLCFQFLQNRTLTASSCTRSGMVRPERLLQLHPFVAQQCGQIGSWSDVHEENSAKDEGPGRTTGLIHNWHLFIESKVNMWAGDGNI